MSKAIKISCDNQGCNQEKDSSNNWWIVRETRVGLLLLPMHDIDPEDEDRHICGTKCMHGVVEDWMQGHIKRNAPIIQNSEEIMIDRSE